MKNNWWCYVPAWMGGCLRENGFMYMYAESLHSSPESIKTLLIGYSPTQTGFGVKKKKKEKKKNWWKHVV